MPDIDADRFLADLTDLRQIGSYKTGVHRPTFVRPPRGAMPPPSPRPKP